MCWPPPWLHWTLAAPHLLGGESSHSHLLAPAGHTTDLPFLRSTGHARPLLVPKLLCLVTVAGTGAQPPHTTASISLRSPGALTHLSSDPAHWNPHGCFAPRASRSSPEAVGSLRAGTCLSRPHSVLEPGQCSCSVNACLLHGQTLGKASQRRYQPS